MTKHQWWWIRLFTVGFVVVLVIVGVAMLVLNQREKNEAEDQRYWEQWSADCEEQGKLVLLGDHAYCLIDGVRVDY